MDYAGNICSMNFLNPNVVEESATRIPLRFDKERAS
jgi:hypothetical protein